MPDSSGTLQLDLPRHKSRHFAIAKPSASTLSISEYHRRRPALQAEFLRFLERSLTDVEEELRKTTKEKDELHVALSQSQKELSKSNHALEELRKKAGGSAPSQPAVDQEVLLNSLRSELRQVSADYLAERANRTKAESSLSDTVAKLERVSADLERVRGLARAVPEENQPSLSEHAREKADLEQQIAQLREQLQHARSACARASAERDQSNVACNHAVRAEQQAQRMLAEAQIRLRTTTKDLSAALQRLSEHTKTPDDGPSRLKLWEFQSHMCALPTPPSSDSVDFNVIPPIKIPTPELQKRIARLTQDKVILYSVHESNCAMWFPSSCHGLLVFPQYSFYSAGPRGGRWGIFPHWVLSNLVNKNACVEVFQNYFDQNYYMGTFKVRQGPMDVRLPDLDSIPFVGKDVSMLDHQLARATAGAAPENNPLALALSEMYVKGIMAVQLLGLQRVGFNEQVSAAVHRPPSPRPLQRILLPPSPTTPVLNQVRDRTGGEASQASTVMKAPSHQPLWTGNPGSSTRAREVPSAAGHAVVSAVVHGTPAMVGGRAQEVQRLAPEVQSPGLKVPAAAKETAAEVNAMPVREREALVTPPETPLRAQETRVVQKLVGAPEMPPDEKRDPTNTTHCVATPSTMMQQVPAGAAKTAPGRRQATPISPDANKVLVENDRKIMDVPPVAVLEDEVDGGEMDQGASDDDGGDEDLKADMDGSDSEGDIPLSQSLGERRAVVADNLKGAGKRKLSDVSAVSKPFTGPNKRARFE